MQEKDPQPIQLGPGGVILNVKANEKLLKEIRKTQPLPSPDLLNLADFFRRYMTDVPLGDHLELVALRQIIYEPNVLQAFIAAGYAANSLPALNPQAEDTSGEAEDSWIPFIGDGGGDESKDWPEPPPHVDRHFVRDTWISFSGVGLLVEIVYYRAKDGNRKKRYYIIGVSPDPRSLEPDAQGRVVPARINQEADPAQNEQY